MKIKILSIFFLLGLAFTGYSQGLADKVFDRDTLTNGGTLTFLHPTTIKDLGTVYFHAAATPISGTAAGTIRYQWSNDGTYWHTEATDTITTGAATDQSHTLTNFAGKYLRIQYVGTGTQSTGVNPSIVFKKQ